MSYSLLVVLEVSCCKYTNLHFGRPSVLQKVIMRHHPPCPCDITNQKADRWLCLLYICVQCYFKQQIQFCLPGLLVWPRMTSQVTKQSCLCTTTGPSVSAPLYLTPGAVLTPLWASLATPTTCTQQGVGHLTTLLESWQRASLYPGLDLQGWIMAVTWATNQMSQYIRTSAGDSVNIKDKIKVENKYNIRSNYPAGRLCSASRMVARNELEIIMKRYRDSDNDKKLSTPSGFGRFIIFSLEYFEGKCNLIPFSRS